MGLFSPWFIAAGLATLTLPVWLHLLKQHKSKIVPFASLMFFERRTQSSIKHRRLKYLLLFALRTALLTLLALAFAKPFLRTAGGGAQAGRKLVVLAIDNSFSMRQGGRLARAREEALRAIGSLRAEDRAQVLAFGSRVQMMSDSTQDRTALRAAVAAVQPGDSRGSYAELTRALRSIAQASRMPVEAHVYSDLQKASLPSNFSDLRLPESVRLITHAAADKRAPNFAVENVIAPRRVYDPKKVRVQATIAGFGTERASRRVTLYLNGRELESKTVEVPAHGRASAEFLSLDAPYGMNRCEIRTDGGDGFPDDDRFYFSVERADPRPALFVHEQRNTRDLLYFRTALDTSTQSAFQLSEAAPEQIANLAPSKYAFVVLSDIAGLPSSFEDALRGYVRGGGAVLIALGRYAALRSKIAVFDEQVIDTRYSGREGERFQTVAYLDPAHPSTRAGWEGVKFYQAVKINPGKARIAARLSDETPLLMEKQIGEGRVIVFASTFDNIANDFPLHASFVPFIERTAGYLGKLDQAGANFAVDSYLELRTVREQGANVEVLDPSGARAMSLEESTKAQNVQLTRAGFYDVRRPSGRHELVAVNADRRESDLDLIPPETLALWQNTAQPDAGPGAAGEEERKPVSLWWYIMIVVLAAAIAESLLGNQHLSLEKEAA